MAKKALQLPPHSLAGYYLDSTGGKFWVPSKPGFALFRCDAEWNPLDPESPVQDDPAHFQKQLDYKTFVRINH